MVGLFPSWLFIGTNELFLFHVLYGLSESFFIVLGVSAVALSFSLPLLYGYKNFLSCASNSLMILTSILFSFIVLEAVLIFINTACVSTDVLSLKVELSRLAGGYDRRELIEFTESYRKEKNDEIFPLLRPINYNVENCEQALPFGSIPRRTITVGKEIGRYLCFKLDRFGFNNPDDVWSKGTVFLGMLGDSYAFGEGAPEGSQIGDLLRKEFTDTLNVSLSGNDPVVEYGSLMEFLAPKRPKYVVWFFAEANDLFELKKRLESFPLYARYLQDAGFSQNLLARDKELEALILREADLRYKAALADYTAKSEAKPSLLSRFVKRIPDVFKFNMIRHSIAFSRDNYFNDVNVSKEHTYDEEELQLMLKIVEKADSLVKSWGGHMIFVYIPEASSYFPKIHRPLPSACVKDRARILSKLKEAGVDILDLDQEYRANGDPLRFYQKFALGGHWSAPGQELAAKLLLNKIKSLQ